MVCPRNRSSLSGKAGDLRSDPASRAGTIVTSCQLPTRGRSSCCRALRTKLRSRPPTLNALRAIRQASQQTTGRLGPEYLIVQDERLARIGDTERHELEARLDVQLHDLDDFITKQIDWERESGLVVGHRRIDELQEKLGHTARGL